MGISKDEMDRRFDDIAAFADIGDFIDQPVRIYSSGMFVRLAFAVAVHVDPEILIVDEALSVGDMAFHGKSMQRMQEMLQAGCALIFVSHDLGAIKSLCRRTMLLNEGSLHAFGDSGEICDDYIRSELIKSKGNTPVHSSSAKHRYGGTGSATIMAVEVDNSPALTCMYGQKMCIRIYYQAKRPLEGMIVSFYIKDERQLDVLGTNTEYEKIKIGHLEANDTGCVEFCFRNPLRGGSYGVTAILADQANNTQHFYDWVDHACYFESHDEPSEKRWAIACPEIHATLRPTNGVEGKE
jgi:ABC-type multidrug transport system ATPase subunit